MNKRWAVTALFVFAAAGGGYYYLNQTSPSEQALPLLTAHIGTIEKQAIAVGQIVPAHSVSIKSQIEGIVGEIYHREGEQVSEGTPLLKVRPNPTPQTLTDATTALMQSEAGLESAKQTLANLDSLVEQKIVPKNYGEYIQAKSDVKSRTADVQQKKQHLDLIRSGEASIGDAKLTSTIVAPINGTILNLKVEIGEPIISTESSQAATEMMSIADMKAMIFKGSVSEHDAAQLSVGMPVTLTLAPYPDAIIEGRLNKVAVQSQKLNDTSSTTNTSFDNGFEVEVSGIHFPDNMTVRSGFSATAEIILQKSEQVTVIPERALRFNGDSPEVLIPDNSEQGFSPRKVTLGLSDGINVEVLSGLSQDEEFIDNSMIGAPNA